MAYMEPKVQHVKLEIDRDFEHFGEHPSVTYSVKLRPFYSFLYKISLLKGFGKLLALLAAYAGAPVGIDSRISRRAVEFLPGGYKVHVKVS
jgi:hypothetical protein